MANKVTLTFKNSYTLGKDSIAAAASASTSPPGKICTPEVNPAKEQPPMMLPPPVTYSLTPGLYYLNVP